MGLRAAGGVVDGEHPRAVALPEAQRVRRVGGVDRRREPVAVPVGEGYGLVEVRERGDADDGAEGLRAVDLILHRNAVDDGRMVVDAVLGVPYETLAGVVRGDSARPSRAVDSVVVLDEIQPPEEPLVEALAQHGAVEHLLCRVSYGRLLDGGCEFGDELVVHVLVDDHGSQGGAALARGAKAREQGAFDGEVEIRIRHDYERVLAPELQAGRLHVPAAELAYLLADLGRACKADLVDEPLVQGLLQSLEGRRSFGLHNVKDAAGEAAGHEEFGQGVADGGGVFGGLPDHGVAAGQCRYDVPRRDRDGEVACRDNGRDPNGDAEGEELFVRHLRGDGLAVEPSSLAGEEVAGVYDLLHLAEGFGVRLADLTGHQPRQCLLVVLDDASDLLYHLRADRGRHFGPLPLRLACTPARLHERARIPEKHLRHRLGSTRRVRRGHASAGGTVGSASPYRGGDGKGSSSRLFAGVGGAHSLPPGLSRSPILPLSYTKALGRALE